MAVIIDMVLNHSYGQSPMVRLYWDNQLSRPAANNPWYNTVSPNPVFSWGYDFNHESIHTKNFVDRVNKFWIKEFKVDGFRFDFTKGFTNTRGWIRTRRKPYCNSYPNGKQNF
jgi:1,4-alpha-glucan branching enzyme